MVVNGQLTRGDGISCKGCHLRYRRFRSAGKHDGHRKLHSTADRVFRAIGNQAGRGRLDATARLRESKPPRALVLSTGEEIPLGQSVRARMLTLEIPKGSISGLALALCQQDGAAGLYSQCMTGFIQSLAGRYDEARASFDRKASHYRAEAFSSILHARTPEIVCSLQAAFEIFLEFAVATGAIDAGKADRLMEQCWNALREAAAAQGKFQGETEPAARYLSLVRALLSAGRAHLATRNGERPEDGCESCGWRADASSNFAPRSCRRMGSDGAVSQRRYEYRHGTRGRVRHVRVDLGLDKP